MLNDTVITLQKDAPARPWSRLLVTFVAAVFLLVVGAVVWKIAPRAPLPTSAEQPKITIQARDTDIGVVLRDVASQSGAVLALDPRLTGKISLKTKDARLADLMNDFCTAYSCTWTLSGGSTPALVVRRSIPSLASDRPKG